MQTPLFLQNAAYNACQTDEEPEIYSIRIKIENLKGLQTIPHLCQEESQLSSNERSESSAQEEKYPLVNSEPEFKEET
ncbi:hypothetical protein Ancab_039382 [Ancistrocladus abbreviatus]